MGVGIFSGIIGRRVAEADKVVLGFFQDRAEAEAAQQRLKRAGILRVALFGPRLEQGAERHPRTPGRIAGAAVLGAVSGALLGWILLAGLNPDGGTGVIVLLAALGLLAGWLVDRRRNPGVGDALVEQFQPWVGAEETLLLARPPALQSEQAAALLSEEIQGNLIAFVLSLAGRRDPVPLPPLLLGQLLTADQLSAHGARLASSHQVLAKATGARLLFRELEDNERVLKTVQRRLNQALRLKQGISLSGEWLVDNAYVVEIQIVYVRRNLSLPLLDVLPVVRAEAGRVEVRIYSIAKELILHTDGRLDEQNIADFLDAYQRTSPLTLAELWAMPLMIGLGLIDSIASLAIEVHQRQDERELAEFYANRLIVASRRYPEALPVLLAELAKRQPHPSAHFAVQLMRQLADEEVALTALHKWLERKLEISIADVLRQEQGRRAGKQVSMASLITSMRRLSELEWPKMLEKVSLVEHTLRSDPALVYPRADFATRDACRHAVEQIARRSGKAETSIAEHAILMAEVAARDQSDESGREAAHSSHVGYFLIGDGRKQLEDRVKCRLTLRETALRRARGRATTVYLGGLTLLTLPILMALLMQARQAGASIPILVVLAVLALLPASEIAVQILNFLVTVLIPPTLLPKMSFKEGVPDEFRTLVVIPTLLSSHKAVEGEIQRLEVRYLANVDSNIRFALFTDFTDAPEAHMPEDDALLQTATDGIDRLTRQYGLGRFLLLYRHREWNQSERRWIGWERKRGKLEDLNRLLTGEESRAGTVVCVGETAMLQGIRFVITLDSDTQLPHGTARRMIETLAHPLNQPIVGKRSGVVVRGYSVVQPLVRTSLPSATATRFTRLFTDPSGTDPYTHVVSDVYQDLCGEGNYNGKGIYDVQIFHGVLADRFPESTLLSHDLLEGAYVRVAFGSDIDLYDQFPANYGAYSSRQHRWTRGDWQIAGWIFPRVPTARGWQRNPLSVLNRWKILDNLRRSLVPIAVVLLLLAAWTVAPVPPSGWVLLAVSVFFVPLALQLLDKTRQVNNWLLSRPQAAPVIWRELGRELALGLLRCVVSIALLPHRALVSSDAIAKVLFRRIVSKQRLLEWETAHAAQRRHQGKQYFRRLVWITVAAALAAVFLGLGGQLAWAVPFLLLWGASSAIVRWLDSAPERHGAGDLQEADRPMLRQIARQTWRYFDDFVGPTTGWLPPDNYQEALQIELAQRTSPTNIGMWLLSLLAGYDFGYVTLDVLAERSGETLATLEKLERHEGHLLNWYNIQTLQPLWPRYVSTVDSANLLASLWALEEGCRRSLEQPLVGPVSFAGMADTLSVLRYEMDRLVPAREADASAAAPWRSGTPPPEGSSQDRKLRSLISALSESLTSVPTGLLETIRMLRTVRDATIELAAAVRERFGASPGVIPASPGADPSYWGEKLYAEAERWVDLADRYLAWVEPAMATPPEERDRLGPVLGEWLLQASSGALSLRALASVDPDAFSSEAGRLSGAQGEDAGAARLQSVLTSAVQAHQAATATLARIEDLRASFCRFSDGVNLRFLYNADRRLLTIGFNVSERRADTSYYDLLASEARLASYIAIARGELPVEHWWVLGRPFGSSGGHPVLLSWGGTMFEYLMPLLFTRTYAHSLLDDACRAAVHRQVQYGRQRGIPWGISEAAFAAIDLRRTYQYRAFGVPGLGLKRSLEEDLVVAPYATILALPLIPAEAVANLKRLAGQGLRGNYGFYEAIDYTRERVPTGEKGVVVQAYMAHHQGMALVALDNALHGGVMQTRFHTQPRVVAAEPLLFERIPPAPERLEEPRPEVQSLRMPPVEAARPPDASHPPETRIPRVQLLSNGDYSVMVTNAGGGYSRWRDIDITRWRADTTRDARGSFFYIRDTESGRYWSTTHQPCCSKAERSAAMFTAEKAEFRRREHGLDTLTEVIVSAEDDAEIRRLTLINHSGRARTLELTSYMELALAEHAADRAHPAFSKMFVLTEALGERPALLAWRRTGSPQATPVWAAHMLAATRVSGAVQYETDRARFVGRGRSTDSPAALSRDLSGAVGAVLDPIFSLRCRVMVEAGERVELSFVTAAADSRKGVVDLVEKYIDPRATDRAVEAAWTHAQLELRQFRIAWDDARQFQKLASHLLYPNAQLRPSMDRLRQNSLGQSGLWPYGISGDLPILLVRIGDPQDLDLVRQVLVAHTFLRARGLKFDLVILDEEAAGYVQPLMERLQSMIQAHARYTGVDQPGGIFLRAGGRIPNQDLTLMLSAAHVVLVSARGALVQQLGAAAEAIQQPARVSMIRPPAEEPSAPLPFMELAYFNGLGGFTEHGREYAIYLGPESVTPAPWVNVIANPEFGTLVSESGSGFTWWGNSQTHRLTAWSNDPISDPATDTLYIRDEELGAFWSPTCAPIREADAYRARHGQGYTIFEHNSHAIEQELAVFVPVDDEGGAPVRVQRLRLRNRSSRRRRLSVFSYLEWVLGTDREETQPHIVTEWDAQSQAVLARNSFSPVFRGRVAFAASRPAAASFSGDRTEFIGRNGLPARPAALNRQRLSGRCGAGLDPCAALQVAVSIEPGESVEVIFLLGEGKNLEEARRWISHFSEPGQVEKTFHSTRQWWDGRLGRMEVTTPSLATNFLLNRWLAYQTLSCRLWGRSSSYQSGGAFGFRDQLQDAMNLIYTVPALTRKQILKAASRQFVEGDVQHWWHAHSGGGARTRISDDLLWLPYVTAYYVRATGDRGILDVVVPFLSGRLLADGEQEDYSIPVQAPEEGTLYEHCRRAIEKGTTRGPHGLPLIGAGDWNDGMNRVGIGGKGESVWLGWFLVSVLDQFATLTLLRGEEQEAARLTETSRELAATIERTAWDGEWYLRAYFDSGTPIGSHANSEAQIDSLPQSWAVISRKGDPSRAARALASVDERLVRTGDGMVLLFTPPFDRSTEDPGYIRAYPPGVRENGGQYTHAALWLALAHALRGDGNRAVALMDMLNPVLHSSNEEETHRYKTEPYVVAADVYALQSQVGRGGWTWYTGSGGWMYRIWVEEILGIKLRGDGLWIDPVIPASWDGFSVRYKTDSDDYLIRVDNPQRVSSGVDWIEEDGSRLDTQAIILRHDGKEHSVVVRMGGGKGG